MDVVNKSVVGVVERLHNIAELYADRNATYQNTHVRFGRIMEAMIPEGVMVGTANDWARIFLLVMRLAKEDRNCRVLAMGGGAHEDSLNDLAAYAQMTNELEDMIRQADSEKARIASANSTKSSDGQFAENARLMPRQPPTYSLSMAATLKPRPAARPAAWPPVPPAAQTPEASPDTIFAIPPTPVPLPEVPSDPLGVPGGTGEP